MVQHAVSPMEPGELSRTKTLLFPLLYAALDRKTTFPRPVMSNAYSESAFLERNKNRLDKCLLHLKTLFQDI